MRRERIAVIGSGIAGLVSARLLQDVADITLYEAAPRLGGHTDTHEVAQPDGSTLHLDTGFIVYNEHTYPILSNMFTELRIPTQPAEMSMSVSCRGCGLEYAGGRRAVGLAAQPRRFFAGPMPRLLWEVRKFHREAARLVADETCYKSVGDFLEDGRYTPLFVHHFMVPLMSATWSTGAEAVLRQPAAFMFRFLQVHGMLAPRSTSGWRTVVGGSRRYVERLTRELTNVRVSAPVLGVRRDGESVVVYDAQSGQSTYDRVVVATHADEALRLLEHPSPLERATLSAFEYVRNYAVLHTDRKVLPQARRACASWNYHIDDCSTAPRTQVATISYDLTRLQRLHTAAGYYVTLNPSTPIEEENVLDIMEYQHPLFTLESVEAASALPLLNTPRVAFAGAYHGWGFHEDGCRSGVAAATALGWRRR